jgi:hypothetical protein
MKRKFVFGDFLAIVYLTAIALFISLDRDIFVSWTKQHSIIMGFAKFFLLGTFGECLKFRLTNTKWIPSKIILRAVIWGIFGIWITWAFVLVDAGVEALIEKGLWLNEYSDSWRTIFWVAFSKSIWINILSGYAFFMMLMHLWTDNMLKTGLNPPLEYHFQYQ